MALQYQASGAGGYSGGSHIATFSEWYVNASVANLLEASRLNDLRNGGIDPDPDAGCWPRLGASLEPGISHPRVVRLASDSAAARAGLMVGDIILALDGVEPSRLVYRDRSPPNSAAVAVLRGSETLLLQVPFEQICDD